MECNNLASNYSILERIPCPAINKDTYQVDTSSVIKRMVAVALATFAAYAAFNPLVGMGFLLTTFVTPFFEIKRAERALDSLAVDEYIKEDRPSHLVKTRIKDNVDAIKLLIQRTSHLSVQDRSAIFNKGTLFFVNTPESKSNLDKFSLLIKNGANLDDQLIRLVTCANDQKGQDSLQYLLESGSLKHENFSKECIKTCWRKCPNLAVGQILKQAGFDPNIQGANGKGDTPLAALLSFTSVEKERVHVLLECGADPSLPCGGKKDAYGLSVEKHPDNLDLQLLLITI